MPPGPHDDAFLGSRFSQLANFQFIATGGQKSVYRARNQNNESIALKIFNPGADAARFQREIDAVRGIQNDRVPRIYDFGVLSPADGGFLWLVEEWIDGESLRSKIEAHSVTDSLILQMGLDLLSVLADAEALNIVHRDVKPENILVKNVDQTCALTDFGISRHLDLSTLTQGPGGLYTCGYSPPEQFRNMTASIDARVDLFALGVTLYECVEGVNPFRDGAASAPEILLRVENTRLPTIVRQIDASGEFSQLVEAMTRTRRTHRIGSASAAYVWMQEIAAAGPR